MSHYVFANGLLVNLLCHKGMTKERALELLAEVNRIQPTDGKPKTNREKDNESSLPSEAPVLLATDAAFHRARHRIRTIEKAIANCVAGQEHGLKRNKWRKEKGDAEAIFHVLGHVLSRKDPVTHNEMVEDARLFLINTGELPCRKEHKPAVTNEYAPIIIKRTDSSTISAKTMQMPDYEVNFASRGEFTRVTIRLKVLLPITMQTAIEETVRQVLGNRMTVTHLLPYVPEAIRAEKFVDWKGMVGDMKAWIISASTGREWNNDEERTILTFEIENARIH